MFDQNFTTILATDPYSQKGKEERQVEFQRKVSISVLKKFLGKPTKITFFFLCYPYEL